MKCVKKNNLQPIKPDIDLLTYYNYFSSGKDKPVSGSDKNFKIIKRSKIKDFLKKHEYNIEPIICLIGKLDKYVHARKETPNIQNQDPSTSALETLRLSNLNHIQYSNTYFKHYSDCFMQSIDLIIKNSNKYYDFKENNEKEL